MQEDLKEWNKILQITGGDLSLDKCKVVIMKWIKDGKSSQSTLVLATKEQHPSTIACKSTTNTGKQASMERLDPHAAERILGVRLPLT